VERQSELESGPHGIGEPRLKLLLAARRPNVEHGDLEGAVSVVDDLDDVGSARSWDGGVDHAGWERIGSVG
jgi:hypothetical protein